MPHDKPEIYEIPHDPAFVVKAQGEGSRGGVVIGHTKSGKPIYKNSGSANHKDFTGEDHTDASRLHNELAQKKAKEAHAKHQEAHNAYRNESGDHKKMRREAKRLEKEVAHHEKHSAKHGDKSEAKKSYTVNPEPQFVIESDHGQE